MQYLRFLRPWLLSNNLYMKPAKVVRLNIMFAKLIATSPSFSDWFIQTLFKQVSKEEQDVFIEFIKDMLMGLS